MRCHRCNNRMMLDGDKYGRYYACLFCGNHIDIGPDGLAMSPLSHVNTVNLPIKGKAVALK